MALKTGKSMIDNDFCNFEKVEMELNSIHQTLMNSLSTVIYCRAMIKELIKESKTRATHICETCMTNPNITE
jgi:hypothetical protein